MFEILWFIVLSRHFNAVQHDAIHQPIRPMRDVLIPAFNIALAIGACGRAPHGIRIAALAPCCDAHRFLSWHV